MSARDERGVALLEVLIVGFAVGLLALTVLALVVRVSEARSEAHAIAVDTSSWYARHGALPVERRKEDVSIDIRDGVVDVTATSTVSVLSVAGVELAFTVEQSATAPLSPYRSGR